MDRARREMVSGRLLLLFFASCALGFLGATLGWMLHGGYATPCPPDGVGQGTPEGQLFYSVYAAFDLTSLLAAVVTGVLYLRAERALGQRHEIGSALGFVGLFGLAIYQAWYVFLTAAAVLPVCFTV